MNVALTRSRRRRPRTERACRASCVTLLLLLCQNFALAQSPPVATDAPGAFRQVKRIGEAASASFEFEMSGFVYHVAANGNGRRTKGDRTRRFSLRLEGGDYIENFYVSEYAGDLLLACGVTDGKSGAGFFVRLEQPSMRARWKQNIPTYNLGEPLREGHYLYATGIGFVGKLNLETGEYVWKHEDLYGRGRKDAFDSFAAPELKGEEVLFKERRVYNERALTVFVRRKTGKIIRVE